MHSAGLKKGSTFISLCDCILSRISCASLYTIVFNCVLFVQLRAMLGDLYRKCDATRIRTQVAHARTRIAQKRTMSNNRLTCVYKCATEIQCKTIVRNCSQSAQCQKIQHQLYLVVFVLHKVKQWRATVYNACDHKML